MSIQYAGGTNRNDTYAAVTTYPGLLANINTTLVAAGWTSVGLAGRNNILYSGQPSDSDTITLSGVVYTFKTTINNGNAREIAISGVDADTTWVNFVACVTGGAGSGTAYSSATTASTVFTASVTSAGIILVETILTGTATNGLTLGDSTANANWQYNSFGVQITVMGGYQWTSAATPAGNKCRVLAWIRDFNTGAVASQARFILADESSIAVNPSAYRGGDIVIDAALKTSGARLGADNIVLPASTWRVVADKYQFFAFADTVYSGAGIYVAAGVPWIPTFLYPKTITAATTSSPVAITTSAVHGWTTGDVVSIAGIAGLTGANGNFTVTVTSTTTATLDGSAGVGVYSSGGVAAEINIGLSNVCWMMNMFSGTSGSWYNYVPPAEWVASILNGSINDPSGTLASGTACLLLPTDARVAEGADSNVWYNTDVLATEPLLTMGINNAGTSYLVGQLWDSFFHSKAESGGTTGTFDSRNWYILTNNAVGSSTEKEGALVLLVP